MVTPHDGPHPSPDCCCRRTCAGGSSSSSSTQKRRDGVCLLCVLRARVLLAARTPHRCSLWCGACATPGVVPISAAAAAMKRRRVLDNGVLEGAAAEEDEADPKRLRDSSAEEQQGGGASGSDSEQELLALPRSSTKSAIKRGHECPYLDTISRQVGQARLQRTSHQERDIFALGGDAA